ncbi:hypothetical protein L596_012679 [Steinernema carpocapsae]|uniref:Uncharacterized protein n=1 Tax=Steinernema carpocapsae TaxID=34508 RepID=A0A4U5NXY5_STECR|nr:hypothetical protein L596_012679 [Steinernema carpocapsae]
MSSRMRRKFCNDAANGDVVDAGDGRRGGRQCQNGQKIEIISRGGGEEEERQWRGWRRRAFMMSGCDDDEEEGVRSHSIGLHAHPS